MVKTNQIKIKKPVLKVEGQYIMMDRHWMSHINKHLDEINLQLPIKKVINKKTHIIVEFINEKTATMFRLKYGEDR
jgi:hypothetical protein